MLTTAPFLVSCRSSRNVQKHQTTQTEQNSDRWQSTDSTLSVMAGNMLVHQHDALDLEDADITIYDTTLPADILTGLPPVKAFIKLHRTARIRDSTASRADMDIKAEVRRQDTRKKRTVIATDRKTDTKTEHTHRHSWLSVFTCLLPAVAAAAVFIKYKLPKNK